MMSGTDYDTIVIGSGAGGLTAALCLAQAACAHSPPAFRSAEVENGSLKRQGQVWVMRLSGTPKQRGKAAGA
ncbi:MAG: FAD-binding protein, partial [Candidatus Promineifilaceae bacterium]